MNIEYNLKETLLILLITAALSVVGNLAGYQVAIIEAIPGALILVGISMLGIILGEILPFKIPSVAYIVTISSIMTIPGFPGSDFISGHVEKVNFLALTTPILAYAGIYTGKNIDALKKSGWRIVILAMVVMFGTYLASAVIANFVLKLLGQI